jgi:hypothetical protein
MFTYVDIYAPVFCSQCSVHSVVYSVLYIVFCTQCCGQCSVHSVVYSVVYTVICIQCCVQCSVQCCVQCSVHTVLYTVFPWRDFCVWWQQHYNQQLCSYLSKASHSQQPQTIRTMPKGLSTHHTENTVMATMATYWPRKEQTKLILHKQDLPE